jgi:penicillin amidase
MSPGLVAPTIFQVWINKLPHALVEDELGELTPKVRGLKAAMVHRCYVLEECAVCDDVTTEGVVEDCDHAASLALDRGVEMLTGLRGEDPADWRWGDVHRTRFDHMLGSVKALAPVLNREVEAGGGPFTVNVSWYSLRKPFDSKFGPSFREVLDVTDWDRSRFIHTTGQSGHPSSPHFDDLVAVWAGNRTIPAPFSPEAVDAAAAHTLVLTPK